ncbi:MAG: hypothetical protein B5M56_00620 [Desulfococcus sp. 4484_241]|nr:MAG: hypothetical protein B5M56_00620 [Desulfococcus sp. 4484_241]
MGTKKHRQNAPRHLKVAILTVSSTRTLEFGMVVSQLSFEQIDSAAILSRSAGGIIGKTAVFCIPGSKNACKLICGSIIFPEAGHIVKHILE